MSQKKKQRTNVGDLSLTEATVADDHQMENLSTDVLANIFRYLGGPKSIMRQRRVSKKWKEAVKKTIVPPIYFCVNSEQKYNAMRVMARAMPNLQLISLGALTGKRGGGHKYSDGEDPVEERAARTTFLNWAIHDVEIISHFSKLCILEIDAAEVNGRYPFLFNSFPLLQILRINSGCIKWDLGMLSGFPSLKVLESYKNYHVTGNISSLRVLKETLEKVVIVNCPNVGGNLMNLVDFPRLRELDLFDTAVTGDIRDIGENHFLSLEELSLPKRVYGGRGYELQRVSDGTSLVRSVFLFKQQRPALKMKHWHCILSEDSPDWYDSAEDDVDDTPPFYIRFVEAGSRIGYRWASLYHINPCEVNWLDPAPDFFRESRVYAKYVEDLQEINSQVKMFKGFHQPPTEEEYNRLVEEHAQRRRAEEEYEESYGYDESDGEE